MGIKREIEKLRQRIKTLRDGISEIRYMLSGRFSQDELTILQYEATVEREYTVINKLKKDEKRRYASYCMEYLRFGHEIDACLNREVLQQSAVWVGTIPPVFEEVGCSAADMYITQKHLRNIIQRGYGKGVHYHGLGTVLMKQLPELLSKPLAIVKGENNTVVAVLDAADYAGRTLIVPIQQNGVAYYDKEKIPANFILTTYGKDNIERYLQMAQKNGAILFLDKKIASTRLAIKPLQLRQLPSSDTYINSIPRNREKVNKIR